MEMTPLPDSSVAGSPESPASWVLHRDAAGLTLQRPAAWQVHSAGPGEVVVSEPRGTAAALVRVRVVPAGTDLAQWLQHHYAATEPGLYNVRRLKLESRGPQGAQASFDYGSNVFEGRARVIVVRRGDVATLFVAAAARAEFVRRLPELRRILDSVRFGASPASAPGT